MDMMKKVPVREQEPAVRAKNFEEVCLGYDAGEAMEEASRCLNCKNAKCIQGCPVSIDIPGFIQQVKEGKFVEAAAVIGKSRRAAGGMRPCVPPGEPVRGEMRAGDQGGAGVHRKAGAVCGGLVP